MATAMFLLPAAAGELQWQRGKTPAAQRAVQKREKITRQNRDGAVRLVQYEVTNGPSFGEHDRGRLRSVMVERNEPAGDDDRGQVRTAQQLEWGGAEPDSRYEEQLRTPFGDEPATDPPNLDQEMDQDMGEDLFPPLDEPPVEQPPTPSDEDLALPPPTDQPTQPRRQPMTEPRRRPPTTQPPRTFEPRPSHQPLPRDTTADEPQSDLGYSFDDASTSDVTCSEELAKLKASTLHDVNLAIVIAGVEGEDFPVECTIDDGTWHSGRCWAQTVYMWKASALCHKPLYFEDEALERYGHSWGPCCDPIVSGAHFFSKLAVLPYCMGLATPCECQYALGHYRPGSCAPYMCDPIPITARAALMQAGAVVGTAALLP